MYNNIHFDTESCATVWVMCNVKIYYVCFSQISTPFYTDECILKRPPGNYLCRWFELAIEEGTVPMDSMCFEELDARITMLLKSQVSIKWNNWPTLNSYCKAFYSESGERAFKMYAGRSNLGRQRNTKIPACRDVNHPAPNHRTMKRWKPEVNFDGGPALEKVAAVCELLQANSSSVAIESEGCTVFPVVCGYDGQPLNQGTFVRWHSASSSYIIDGIQPQVRYSDVKDTEETFAQYIKTNCKFNSEVIEYYIIDVKGLIAMNVGTVFSTSGTKHTDVARQLASVVHAVQICHECILNKHSDCRYASQHAACERCQARSVTCIRLCVAHCYADMQASQRVAHELMQSQAPDELHDPKYRRYGFGILHMCKALVGYARNYRITDGIDIFCINMLVALWLSASYPSTLLTGINGKVFSYRDRHSDHLAYSTVSHNVEDALVAAKIVVVTIAPEQYRPWSQEAKDHRELSLGRPLFITVNRQGHCIWSDPIDDCLFMGNRHNPMKIKPIGQPQCPGKPSQHTISAEKAQFCKPTGVKIVPGAANKETCMVCDTGNGVLRYVDNCHTIQAKQSVGTLQIENLPAKFKPYAIALVNESSSSLVLAVSDEAAKAVYLIKFGVATFTGHLTNTIQGFSVSPSGLAVLSKKPARLLIADHSEIKVLNVRTGSLETVISGKKPLAGMDVSKHGKLAVASPLENKVLVFDVSNVSPEGEDEEGEDQVWGSGKRGNEDGTYMDASFDEPTGVAFDGETAMVACFGGEHGGCVKIVTGVTFAIEYIRHVRHLYDLAGYVSKKDARKEDSRHMRRGNFKEGVHKFQQCVCYLKSINEKRNLTLQNNEMHNKYIDSSCGGLYPKTLDCLQMTADSLNAHMASFEEVVPESVDQLSMYAFLNEAPVEHGFGQRSAGSQYRHPSHEQYSCIKADSEENYIRKLCEVKYSHFTTEEKQYQQPRQCDINAERVIHTLHYIQKQYHQKEEPSEEDREEAKKLKRLNCIYRPEPTQTVRDKYRAKNGYAPVTVQRADQSSAAYLSSTQSQALSSFQGILHRTGDKRKQQHVVVEDMKLHRGDIVPVVAGANYNHSGPQLDTWWLLQVSQPLRCSGINDMTKVIGMWLDKVEKLDDGRTTFVLLDSRVVKVPFGSLIKDEDDGEPLVVPVDVFSTDLSSDDLNNIIYSFHPDYIQQLDEIGEEAQNQLTQSNKADSDSEEEDDSHELDQQHQQQVIVNQSRARSISAKGKEFSSYADLLKGK